MIAEAAIAAGLILASRRKIKAQASVAPPAPPPSPAAPTGYSPVSTAIGDAAYSATLAKSIASGNLGAAGKLALSDPKKAALVGVRTALASVTAGLTYVLPAIFHHGVTNPATPLDQRERVICEYMRHFGNLYQPGNPAGATSTADADFRVLADLTLRRKQAHYGRGWGWTPDVESLIGPDRDNPGHGFTNDQWLLSMQYFAIDTSREALMSELVRIYWSEPHSTSAPYL